MNYVEKFFDGVQYVFSINAATFSGAIDIIVVEQPDGTLLSSPFHVRFGKLELVRTADKVVTISVNDVEVDLRMKLGNAGEAFFVERTDEQALVARADTVDAETLMRFLATSPPISPPPMSPADSARSEEQAVDVTVDAAAAGPDDGGVNESEDRSGSLSLTEQLQSDLTRLSASNASVASSAAGETDILPANEYYIGDEATEGELTMPAESESDVGGATIPERERSASSKRRGWSFLWGWGALPEVHDRDKSGTSSTVQSDTESGLGGAAGAAKSDSEVVDVRRREYDSVDGGERRTKPLDASPKTAANHLNALSASASMTLDNGDRPVSAPPIADKRAKTWTDSFMSAWRRGSATDERTSGANVDLLGSGGSGAGDDDDDVYDADDDSLSSFDDNLFPLDDVSDESYSRSGDSDDNAALAPADAEIGTAALPGDVVLKENARNKRLTDVFGLDLAVTRPQAIPRRSRRCSDTLLTTLPTSTIAHSAPPLTDPYRLRSLTLESADAATVSATPVPTELSSLTAASLASIHVHLSLCAPLDARLDLRRRNELFDAAIVDERTLTDANPDIFLRDPRLMVRLNGELMTWQEAVPRIAEAARNATEKAAAAAATTKTSSWREWLGFGRAKPVNVDVEAGKSSLNAAGNANATSNGTPIASESGAVDHSSSVRSPPRVVVGGDTGDVQASESVTAVAGGESSDTTKAKATNATSPLHVKSVRPTSEQLAALNLHRGRNKIQFSATSSVQGTKSVTASVYLWHWTDQIVISDIDGTITKSDMLGHVLPSLGKDWSHAGVAQLYSNIRRNNYKLLYLTSRPIGSANRTRGYINNLKQDGDISLPEGPVLMSPERLLTSLHTELIVKRADRFKVACLTDIKSLFPAEAPSPFYAGFGNRATDQIAYRAVGISHAKIFIIDYSGTIRTDNHTYNKTYTSLNDMVDRVFPPITDKTAPLVDEKFNSFQFWAPSIEPWDALK